MITFKLEAVGFNNAFVSVVFNWQDEPEEWAGINQQLAAQQIGWA